MYISIVFIGFFYSMFFLPVCLRYLGSRKECKKIEEEKREKTLLK